MPRTYAPLLTSIWGDEDFTAWPSSVQRTYTLMMSQPNVTYAGVVAYTPKRWARMAPDTTVSDIEADVEWLHGRGKVVLDETTEEVWIRSFIRTNKVLEQRQLHASLRKEYAGILSQTIARAILCTLDDAGRRIIGAHATQDTQTPTSEGSSSPSRPPSPAGSPEPSPAATPPGPGQRPEPEPLPEPEPSSSESDSRPERPPPDDDELIRSAIRHLARNDLARRQADKGHVGDPDAWVAKAIARRHERHYAEALDIVHLEPGLTAQQLADRLAPPVQPPATNDRADPTSSTVAASRTIAERNRRRANGQTCPTCNDDGLVLDDHDTARPCPTCNPLA